jgi:hypothetical protein
LLRSLCRNWCPKQWPNSYFTPTELATAINNNRKTLAEVEKGFTASTTVSPRAIGTSQKPRRLVDAPIGSQPTISDLLVHLIGSLTRKLNYLEIGAACGLNFLYILGSCRENRLTILNFEDMQPDVACGLKQLAQMAWPLSRPVSRTHATSTELVDASGGKQVQHMATDLFDEESWRRLADRRFNCIFTDSLSCDTEAWMCTWKMIEKYKLLDMDEFIMVWDGIGLYTSVAFDRIAEQLQGLTGPCAKLTLKMRGIKGVNEYPHHFGLVAKLDKPPAWLQRWLEQRRC